jgi:uncharacterized protein with HEPN domain
MRLEAKKYLFDIQTSAGLLGEFIANKQFSDYEHDAMLRAAVERKLEIIGEALAQLARIDSQLVARISDYRRIIAFRNILIHGYADVDNRLVWGVLEAKLPALRSEVERLLAED